MDGSKNWPAWYNGPNGETKICNSPDEVPKGWTTGAEKRPVSGAAPAPAAGTADGGEIDAHGHPWSADLHASTKAKTKDGLWRMAVGKARPAPLEGFPKPPLDL